MSKRHERIERGPAIIPSQTGAGARHVSLRVELLTRQFGGGSIARSADPDRWLRPTSVRGALRFWWRALYGAQYETGQSMRKAEAELFGSAATSGPSSGSISVFVDSEKLGATDRFDAPQGDVARTAYFPALPLGETQSAQLVRPGLKARIELTAKSSCEASQWSQIKNALAAYVTFGGSGARTRRTAGALGWCDAKEAADLGIPTTIEAWATWWSSIPRGGADHRIFSLHDRVLLAGKKAGSAEGAQRDVLGLWREIRQWRRHPPTWTGPGPWGRSDWPEADAIRAVFKRNSLHHEPRPGNKGKAPRAHFGLPLIVKFKERSGDPEKAEIVLSSKSDRYATPIVTAIARLDHGYVGLVLVTKSRLSGKVEIKGRTETLNVGHAEDAFKRVYEELKEREFVILAGGAQ